MPVDSFTPEQTKKNLEEDRLWAEKTLLESFCDTVQTVSILTSVLLSSS